MSDQTQSEGLFVIPADRIVEKVNGCWNCLHFATGPEQVEEYKPRFLALKNRVKLSGSMDVAGLEDGSASLAVSHLMGKGFSLAAAVLKVEEKMLALARKVVGPNGDPWDADKRVISLKVIGTDLESGKAGACKNNGVDNKGNPVGVFVYSGHLCHKWSGREGWSVAVGSSPLDPLPDEMLAIVDAKAKKV